MQHLCIDIGNTRTKTALCRNGRIVQIFTGDALPELTGTFRAAIVQTGNDVHGLRSRLAGRNIPVLDINAGIRLPFQLHYDTPATLGADRIALAAGARQLFSGDLLVVDAGTCITYDIVTAGNVYLGGAISPGVQMRYRAMHEGTAGLPLPGSRPDEIPFPAANTFDALHAGAVLGAAAEIDGMFHRAGEKLPAIRLVLTGGDGETLRKYIKSKIFAFQKNLLFLGMDALLHLNPAE